MQIDTTNVTRATISGDLRKKFKFTRAKAKDVVDTFFNILSSAFLAEKRVSIRGFGTFDVVERKQRIGRNPKIPKKTLIILAKKEVKFSQSDKLDLKPVSNAKPTAEKLPVK